VELKCVFICIAYDYIREEYGYRYESTNCPFPHP